MAEYVIFSIDNVNDVYSLSKFLHRVSVLESMQKTEGKMQMFIGSYKGALEQSFLMLESDFHHVSEFVKNQESFMYVSDGHRGVMYAELRYNNGDRVQLGRLASVSKGVALQQEAWTYQPATDVYWITI